MSDFIYVISFVWKMGYIVNILSWVNWQLIPVERLVLVSSLEVSYVTYTIVASSFTGTFSTSSWNCQLTVHYHL